MKLIYTALPVLFLIASCSGEGKKVLVMASGKLEVNGNTVNLQPGTTHNEATLVPDGESVTVVSPLGSKSFSVKQDGMYILNLKNDTIVGSYQRTGTDNAPIKVSQEELKGRIDSLVNLMEGNNVNEQAKQYNIPPMSLKKITDNTKATIVGPFKLIPASFPEGEKPEVYKFFTNKEMSDMIGRLRKLSN